MIIAARFMPTRPGQPTEQEIRTVQQAWSAASTNANLAVAAVRMCMVLQGRQDR
ncbi:hypothetical protein AB0D27_02080 [Streptomyces sp. NPDC048415]|uniref:hypothetical protein n=1 Tax=Streptomyces sp. NPDC048415 TaxID=3154822 RepID=UPI003415F59B